MPRKKAKPEGLGAVFHDILSREEDEVQFPSTTIPVPLPGHDLGGSRSIMVDGEVVADAMVSEGFDENGDIQFTLTIKERFWRKVSVVCEGDAVEVETEPRDDGRYTVRKKVRSYRPAYETVEETIELPQVSSTKEFMSYVESLDTDKVKALRQIYFDRWNFDTGSTRDRMYYELLDEELQGRS